MATKLLPHDQYSYSRSGDYHLSVPDRYNYHQHYNKQYRLDQQYSKLFTLFSLIAIFISILGLLGLSIYSTSQKIKEIGIRKVLGASGLSIYQLLIKEILILITISSLLAIPVAHYVIGKWLDAYAFKVNPPWWIYLVPIIIIFIISLSTITRILLKAIKTNPSNILRYE